MKSIHFAQTFLLAGLILPGMQGAERTAAPQSASLELYGTFQAMGVIVSLSAGDDPEQNAVAGLAYRPSGQGAFGQGFPLSRIGATRFVGSLFWLQAGTSYDVRVTFSDPGGILDGVSVQSAGATRSEVSLPTPSQAYYVSNQGNGSLCSLAQPCGLTEGLNRVGPGQAVILRGGVYYQGEINRNTSGTAEAPILIQGYPGEVAVLDGADPAAFSWIDQGGGVYRTGVNAPDPHLICANGQRLYPYQNLTDLQNLAWGIPGFYAGGSTVYVHLAGNADPNAAIMVISRYNYAFTIAADYYYLLNLTFRHYGGGDYAKAVYLNNADNNVIQNCTFAINDLGIGIKNEAHRNLIQNNTFYDTNFDWPWDAVKAGSQLETGGVRFFDPATGRGTVIRGNQFHNYFDGFGVCPGNTAGVTNETDVYQNLVYNAGDDGMETDGQCSNVRIWGNTFHDVLMGISLAPVYGGPVYALRNLIYRTGAGNNSYSGAPFKFNSGYGASGPIFLFHNTGDAALADNNGFEVKSPGSWARLYVRNNIWAGTAYALSNANPNQPLDMDYDDLYTTLPGELAYWEGLPDRHLRTLPMLQAASGQELHGINQAPGFHNAAGGDYRLSPTSGLIDVGLIIPGINADYLGSGPDLGAFEQQNLSIRYYLPLILK